MIASPRVVLSMEVQTAPTLRDLHLGIVPTRVLPVSRRRAYAWIDEDPDLAPAPRREVPLTAWA
jgi:hypothetical protein